MKWVLVIYWLSASSFASYDSVTKHYESEAACREVRAEIMYRDPTGVIANCYPNDGTQPTIRKLT